VHKDYTAANNAIARKEVLISRSFCRVVSVQQQVYKLVAQPHSTTYSYVLPTPPSSPVRILLV
jgi:hypothetical protein